MVRSMFSIATFWYRSEVNILHQLPVRNLSDPNSSDYCCDLEIIIEEDIDDEPYTELVLISASKPLNPEVEDFRPPHVEMPGAVENTEADGDGMENPMQTDSQQMHTDPVVPGAEQQCDAGYPAIPNSVLPISDWDERPTEVIHSESGPELAEADPIQIQLMWHDLGERVNLHNGWYATLCGPRRLLFCYPSRTLKTKSYC